MIGIIVTSMRKPRRLRVVLTGIGAGLIAFGLATASASSANVSHSYHSAGSITNGSLVSLDPQQTDYVEMANSYNGSRLLGVAVASNDSLLAVDPNSGEVQVATSGSA